MDMSNLRAQLEELAERPSVENTSRRATEPLGPFGPTEKI